MVSSVLMTLVSDRSSAELAQTWIVNGSQTLLADPERPVLYQLNHSADMLLFIDPDTGGATETLALGDGPTSMDMSQDGALLYVAISGGDCITVIDLESRTSIRDIALDFSPFSVTAGRPDRIYVSDIDEFQWRIVDESSGEVQNTQMWYPNTILEASPDGEELLAISCDTSPTKVNLYDISTDNPSLTAADDHDLGSNFQQHVADWLNDTLFLANAAPYGLEIVSLSDLSRTGFLEAQAYTTGVALSPDKSLAYCLCSEPYSSSVYVFEAAADGLYLGSKEFPPLYQSYLEATADGKALFVVDPFIRISLKPTLTPSAPVDGAVYGYSPAFVEMLYVDGLPAINTSEIMMKINGMDMTLTYPDDHTVRGTGTGYMPDGTYWVDASAPWWHETIHVNWTFEVDRTDPSALRPALIPEYPEPDSVIDYPSGIVVASIDDPNPSPLYNESYMLVNGAPMESVVADGKVLSVAEIGLLEPGLVTIEILVFYDFSYLEMTASWSFTLEKYMVVMPEITPVTPAPYSYMVTSPGHIEFDMTFGEPEIVILWLNVTLDGDVLDCEFSDDDTVRAEVDGVLHSGEHLVVVTVVWDIGTVSNDWVFYVDLPWELSVYESEDGFDLPLPTGWPRTEEEHDGVIEIEALGPVIGGITTTVAFETARNDTIRETAEYMDGQIQEMVEELAAEGIDADLEWTAYQEVGGHFGVVFSLSLDIVDGAVLVSVAVSDTHDRFWVIMMVFSSSIYEKANATFAQMVDGFEVTLWGPFGVDASLLLVIAAVAGAAVAAPVGAFLYMRRKGRKDAPPSPASQPSAAPSSGFCGMCGAPQQFTNTICSSCGKRLPSPPFGATGQGPPPGAGG